LHASGLRFTVNRRDLPGTPDIAFSKAKIAVFVDGCFWHGCSQHGVVPKNNRDWWQAKLEGNRERDERKDAALAERGWLAIHFWEHEAVPDMVSVVTRLWRERTCRC
jgi:DNA mismatch endonuclease (patch repair protein)